MAPPLGSPGAETCELAGKPFNDVMEALTRDLVLDFERVTELASRRSLHLPTSNGGDHHPSEGKLEAVAPSAEGESPAQGGRVSPDLAGGSGTDLKSGNQADGFRYSCYLKLVKSGGASTAIINGAPNESGRRIGSTVYAMRFKWSSGLRLRLQAMKRSSRTNPHRIPSPRSCRSRWSP